MRNITVGTPAFRRAFEKIQRFRATSCGGKKRTASAPKSKGVKVLVFTLVEKPRCQTLKLRVRSAALRSCSRNENRSITGNET